MAHGFYALNFFSPAFADQRGQAKEQVEFGIQVAQRGLWKEAIYRWERAAQQVLTLYDAVMLKNRVAQKAAGFFHRQIVATRS